MILVLAGNLSEFKQWCGENGKKEGTDAIYVHSRKQLEGWEKPVLIRVGQWESNPAKKDFGEYQDYLHVMYPETRVRQFPPAERVDTGPIQFGKDWPGLFIRGDHAFAFRLLIEDVLGENVLGAWNRLRLESLANLLDECNLNPRTRRNSAIKIETPVKNRGTIGNG